MKYSYGPYNKFDDKEQWIRLTEGCPNNCSYCYEPREYKLFETPELIRNDVKIIDMNLLCKPIALERIQSLGRRKANGKCIYYELVCGVDYRYLTQELASALKQARFRKIRIAWDYGFYNQLKIKDAIQLLLNAGYSPKNIMVFMICNWETDYESNLRKLDLCKVWNVQVSDCWYDNQTAPNIEPRHWSKSQIKDFRRRSRDHNRLVSFRYDPEYKTPKVIEDPFKPIDI